MKTIRMTIDNGLLLSVDQMIAQLSISRSAFICEARQMAICRYPFLQWKSNMQPVMQSNRSLRMNLRGGKQSRLSVTNETPGNLPVLMATTKQTQLCCHYERAIQQLVIRSSAESVRCALKGFI